MVSLCTSKYMSYQPALPPLSPLRTVLAVSAFFRRDGVSIFSVDDTRRIVYTGGFAGSYGYYCRFLVLHNTSKYASVKYGLPLVGDTVRSVGYCQFILPSTICRACCSPS